MSLTITLDINGVTGGHAGSTTEIKHGGDRLADRAYGYYTGGSEFISDREINSIRHHLTWCLALLG